VTTVVVFGKDEEVEVEVEVEEVEVCHETSTFFAVRGERERARLLLGLWTTQRPRGLKIERRWVLLVSWFVIFYFFLSKQIKLNGCLYI
jgi:hypothetical protein